MALRAENLRRPGFAGALGRLALLVALTLAAAVARGTPWAGAPAGPALDATEPGLARQPFEAPAICPTREVACPFLDAARLAPAEPPPMEQGFRSLLGRVAPGAGIVCPPARPSALEPVTARLGRIVPYLGSDAVLFVVHEWVECTAPAVPREYRGWGEPRWFDPYFARPLIVWPPPGQWQAPGEDRFHVVRRAAPAVKPTRPKPSTPIPAWTPPASIEERLREQRERIERVIRPPTYEPPLPKIPGLPGVEPDPPPKK